MKLIKVTAAGLLISLSSFAGERFIGSILLSPSTITRNYDTLTPFRIPLGTKISIQCNADTFINTDSTGSGSVSGVKLLANQMYDTSVASNTFLVLSGERTALLAAFSIAGGTCVVWERKGNERFGQ